MPASDLLVKNLRITRELLKLSQEAWASRIHYSASQVSGIERGERPVTPDYLDVVDRAFGTAFVEYYDEHVRVDPSPVWLKSWLERQKEATLLRYFELAVVPALLQTEAYARELIEASTTGPAAEDAIATRLARREILTRDLKPVRLTAILDENVLYRHVGGARVMREQLLALTEARRDTVSVYVVPAEVGSYIGLDGSFALATTHGRVVGFVDGPLHEDAIEDIDRVDDLERRWELIRRYTPTQERSLELITKAADTWAT
ncbi:helix-turn-helix transcriptional regulator [Solwaraspora sp. WMMD1047]|uniref:helix-turn-helix domain-containing protein n=1 Tax=Solwaraspora sp. WMMD1047 TaxID=3016102 RepID=UPI0024175E3B|nr:helix-turn-helix transcriptional regulator [Solwaraspora sp. WMMD1047]MDG4830195.1 helix-turn-helix transcriptional regulator [Solwaraspora sp. WMMD1047]